MDNNKPKTLHLIGYASDAGGAKAGSAAGPEVLQKSPFLAQLEKHGIKLEWDKILKPLDSSSPKDQTVVQLCRELADRVYQLAIDEKFFVVFGGDHSSAIGTWSGAFQAVKQQGSLGLIWIDAHMDSHTPETSPTGNIHGMPVASLLGYGLPEYTELMSHHHKLDPRHLCLIGIRSFEPGEAELIKRLNVRVFFMEEVKQRGLEIIMQEAILHVTQQTAGFGVSIDIDSMDPKDAPGTGVQEPDGIPASELIHGLRLIAGHPKLMGVEIVEFDPKRDQNHLTEKLIPELLRSLTLGK